MSANSQSHTVTTTPLDYNAVVVYFDVDNNNRKHSRRHRRRRIRNRGRSRH